MADVNVIETSFLLAADDVYLIGDTGPTDAGSILVHIDTESAGTVAVTPKARARGATAAAFQPVPYLSLNAAGTATAYATGSIAAVAGDSIIVLQGSGLEFALDCNYTDGTHRAYIRRISGAAA